MAPCVPDTPRSCPAPAGTLQESVERPRVRSGSADGSETGRRVNLNSAAFYPSLSGRLSFLNTGLPLLVSCSSVCLSIYFFTFTPQIFTESSCASCCCRHWGHSRKQDRQDLVLLSGPASEGHRRMVQSRLRVRQRHKETNTPRRGGTGRVCGFQAPWERCQEGLPEDLDREEEQAVRRPGGWP